MHFAVFLPYLIIVSGLALGLARMRAAMRPWGICMIGALNAPGVIAVLFAMKQMLPWYLVAVSVALFTAVLVIVVRDLNYPPINDVTTDLRNPPVFNAALRLPENLGRKMTFPESFKAKAQKAYPHSQSLKSCEPAEPVFDKVVDAANRQRGWHVHHADGAARTVEAEVVTPFLGFVDDVIIRVSEQDGFTCVDIRSTSREGLVDAGRNAKRIASFFESLQQGGVSIPATKCPHQPTSRKKVL